MPEFEINAHWASLGDVRNRKKINNYSDTEINNIHDAYLAVYGITNRDDSCEARSIDKEDTIKGTPY